MLRTRNGGKNVNRKDSFNSYNSFECKKGSIESWKKIGKIPDEREVSCYTARGQESYIFRGICLK